MLTINEYNLRVAFINTPCVSADDERPDDELATFKVSDKRTISKALEATYSWLNKHIELVVCSPSRL